MVKQVVIIGTLISLTRTEARRALAEAGCELSERVTRSTSIIVMGARGPHFQPNGSPLLQLARARRLVQEGVPLEILQESGWLESLGLATASDGVRKRFTAGQIVETLQISRAAFDRWLAADLVRPAVDSGTIPLFDFQQVTAARTLAELARGGVRLAQIKRAAAQLAQWLPNTENLLTDFSLIEDARRLIVRMPDGQQVEPSGQLLFDFDAEEKHAVISLSRTESQSDAFQRAVACADEQPLEAVAIYRQIIADHGIHPTLAFNLANALYAADDPAAALIEYERATELAPEHAGAWNNLANVLTELNQLEEALDAYRRALAIDPALADARFNLAQTLVELGRRDESVLHWRAYLANDPDSTWADYAREQLEA